MAVAKRDRAVHGWSLVVIAEHILRSHALPATGEVVIGRSEKSDIQLDDPSISRRHAVLHVGPQLELEDLGSANGSQVGERRLRVRERVVIGPGDSIELGDVVLVLQPRALAPATKPATLVIDDAAMQQLHRIADRVAVGTISVLLLGETGVGKEVMARRIHEHSPRAGAPFVSLNCAALSEQLLESELFGYEKGAFTGAERTKPGLLETAEGGTIFLDEVGEMPLALQSKLLRVLEERQLLRVGALKARPIDVRFVAATNRDLDERIARGAFRADLYFRLNGISLVIPPLRERRSEILVLATSFIDIVSAAANRAKPPVLSERAAAVLAGHDWPGNIRELRNAMERAVLLADDVVEPEHVPLGSASVTPSRTGSDLHGELGQIERERILQVLEECGGNQSKAAIALGISRGTLATRLKAYGVIKSKR